MMPPEPPPPLGGVPVPVPPVAGGGGGVTGVAGVAGAAGTGVVVVGVTAPELGVVVVDEPAGSDEPCSPHSLRPNSPAADSASLMAWSRSTPSDSDAAVSPLARAACCCFRVEI